MARLDQTESTVWFLAESSSRQPSVATTFRNAASTEVHRHSPIPSFPGPVRLDGSGSPWASPVCCRTPRYRDACAGWEPTWALVGAVVTRHRPLIWSDFVSHAAYVICILWRYSAIPLRRFVPVSARPAGPPEGNTSYKVGRRSGGPGPLPRPEPRRKDTRTHYLSVIPAPRRPVCLATPSSGHGAAATAATCD
jgi:hypothetical protein